MTKEEANKVLAEKVAAAGKALEECENFAEEHGLYFSWSPFYGGGGYYQSKKYLVEEEGYSEEEADADSWDGGAGWRSSSHGC